ncbi:MAG: glutamate--tRNA ligase [Limosilactobacillus sp.]|uniref:glutamate--tRNA ligase n=1 Tax=Limosilactobacillus sp. TaxID=2773925 RepID=UPI0026FE6252|nr:glutamate--tRNA ligase [Limosilactobacillus sp.]
MDQKVRVRYAPSPTGYLHIGNAQSALFNYLFARHFNGTMVLRIEDTDTKRNVNAGEESQRENLHWLGIDWDEGPNKPNPKYAPYRQSERNEQGIYHKYIQELLDKGYAYKDYSTPEELEEMRERQRANGEAPHYDGRWYGRSEEDQKAAEAQGLKPTIRFHFPEDHEYEWDDIARGHVSFNSDNLGGDFIIEKSDGMPTYNFAVVVDDHSMEITHVLRGADHISNTPKQMAIYEALGWDHPTFCHIPLIFNPKTRKKLSKRDKDTLQFINEYKKHGYLPEAIFNFIAFLGWSPVGEREIYSPEELIKVYDPDRMSKAPAYFDQKKMDWMNAQYIKDMDVEELTKRTMDWVNDGEIDEAKNLQSVPADELKVLLAKTIHVHQRDVNTLMDIAKHAWDYYTVLDQQFDYSQLVDDDKFDNAEVVAVLNGLKDKIANGGDDEDFYSQAIKEVGKDTGIKGRNLYFPLNLAFTGSTSAPQIYEIMAIYSKDTDIELLDRMIAAF